MREKCPYSEFFWPVFSRIRTEYGEILCISTYSAQTRENTDQENSEYGYFSRSFIFAVWKVFHWIVSHKHNILTVSNEPSETRDTFPSLEILTLSLTL